MNILCTEYGQTKLP